MLIQIAAFRGSASTYLRCGEHCYTSFVANFITFLAVKIFLKIYTLNFGQLIASQTWRVFWDTV